jgi:hypothetical protein
MSTPLLVLNCLRCGEPILDSFPDVHPHYHPECELPWDEGLDIDPYDNQDY